MIYKYTQQQLVDLEDSVAFVSNYKNSNGNSAAVEGSEEKTRALNELSRINLRREELIKIVLDIPEKQEATLPKPRSYSPFEDSMEYHESFAK